MSDSSTQGDPGCCQTNAYQSVSSHSKIGVAPLTGKLRDEAGDRLTPTHTKRHGRRLRYYVSNRLISGGTDRCVWRLTA
jgi:site-specific DNA recombinase